MVHMGTVQYPCGDIRKVICNLSDQLGSKTIQTYVKETKKVKSLLQSVLRFGDEIVNIKLGRSMRTVISKGTETADFKSYPLFSSVF